MRGAWRAVLIHSGYAAAGAGTPGGGGFKLKYARPIPYIDDLAADHPGLTIIMAHPAWPWVDEQVAVALHKPNVYIDLSGWAPLTSPGNSSARRTHACRTRCYLAQTTLHAAVEMATRVRGTRNTRRPRQKILLDNAKRVLGL